MRVGVSEPENQVSFFRRMGVLILALVSRDLLRGLGVLALVSRDLFRGVGVLALGCPGTFSEEWVSWRWGVQGPFQRSGCPGAGVSRDLFRGVGVLSLG